jgi:2-polyprenyl-3-methyl-5-hydroxy-6-metoxy-1,4-benzoquinol methylase
MAHPRRSRDGRGFPRSRGRVKEEIYPLTFELEQSYWWYAARRRIVMSQIQALLKRRHSEEHLRLLDYGCGTGLNLVHLAQFGEAYGVDVSATAIAFCRKRGLANVVPMDASLSPDADSPFGQLFDVVTMLDVLEHIPDDELALKIVSRWLQPGGVVVVTVPAFEFLWSGEDYVSQHARRYSRRSLRQVLRQAGYAALKLTYFNAFLFPAQVAVILWNRVFHPRSMYVTNLTPLPRSLNSLLTAIMSCESPWLRQFNLPIGGSLLACGQVARREEKN